jgi:O-antigen/teichoic acid export membrane protein
MTLALDLTGILLFNRIGEALFRYYHLSETIQEQKQIICTAFLISVGLNTLGAMLLCGFSSPISSFISSAEGFRPLFMLFSLTLVFEAMIVLPLIHIRLQERPVLYLCINLLKLFTQIGCNLYFIVFLNLHIEGMVYSSVISSSLIALILSAITLSNTGLHFKLKFAKGMMLFSAPMMLASVASFILTYGDRYFLKIYNSAADIGIYSLAYKFGFLLATVAWDPFAKYWDNQRYTIYKSGDRQLYQRFFLYISSFLVCVALGESLFVSDLLKIMSAPEFWSAARYVPLITLAYLLVCWTFFCNFGLLVQQKTIFIAISEVVAASIIILSYWLLIPNWGILGAAIATIIGFFARLIFVNHFSNKFYDMQLRWTPIYRMLIAAGLAYACSLIVTPDNPLIAILCKAMIYLAFVAYLALFITFSKEDKEFIFSQLKLLKTTIKRG